MSTVEPVFFLRRSLPTQGDTLYDSLEICLAAEKVSGPETILGAQDIRGLWRVYPLSREARNCLLINGITLRGCTVQAHDKNPYIVRENGQEVPVTKVWVSDIPLSCDGKDIETALVRLGCVLRSSLIFEKIRNKDGKLTRFLTGRRFIFINTPAKPLERFLQIGGFNTRIYHKEQPKREPNQMECSKCLLKGHVAYNCTNPVRCRQCFGEGHKSGDPSCPDVPLQQVDDKEESEAEDQGSDEEDEEDGEEDEDNGEEIGGAAAAESNINELLKRPPPAKSQENMDNDKGTPKRKEAEQAQDRSRATTKENKSKKQSTLAFTPRTRSNTPKRPRAEVGDSPDSISACDKQARLTGERGNNASDSEPAKKAAATGVKKK